MKKILIIDDEKDFCAIVKANLELSRDYNVITATSGKDGLRTAERDKPDLILLDIMMPEIDGFEVLKRLKENDKTVSIPVIMLTAKGDQESQEKAMQLYDEDYIVKPVETALLKSKIEDVLARFKKSSF